MGSDPVVKGIQKSISDVQLKRGEVLSSVDDVLGMIYDDSTVKRYRRSRVAEGTLQSILYGGVDKRNFVVGKTYPHIGGVDKCCKESFAQKRALFHSLVIF